METQKIIFKVKDMNKLYEILHPEIKLMHKRLTGNDPCTDCENMHRFTRGISWEETPINANRCDSCMDKIFYKIDCMDKLRWYEDNDSRVNTLEQKDTNKYDSGVKCPMSLSKGYPVLYPNGWARK